MAKITPAMKKLYAHALIGIGRELEMVTRWPQTSEGAVADLTEAMEAMMTAAIILKQNGEPEAALLKAAVKLGEAAYRSMPERGEDITKDAHVEVNHIRVELGYV